MNKNQKKIRNLLRESTGGFQEFTMSNGIGTEMMVNIESDGTITDAYIYADDIREMREAGDKPPATRKGKNSLFLHFRKPSYAVKKMIEQFEMIELIDDEEDGDLIDWFHNMLSKYDIEYNRYA